MNTKSYPFLGLAILIMLFSSLRAQNDSLGFFMESTTVEAGEIVQLDILVKDYSNILSTNFTLQWDSLNLRFVGVDNIALDLSFSENFYNLNAGALRFLFVSNFPDVGVSLDDDSVFFTLKLEAIADESVLSAVCFQGLVDVVNLNEVELSAETPCSEVDISVMVDANDLVVAKPFSATVTPNPFMDNATVVLEIPVGGESTWTLSEMNGQVVKRGVEYFAAGEQILNLKNTLFTHTGSYILKVENGGLILTKKLIYIEP